MNKLYFSPIIVLLALFFSMPTCYAYSKEPPDADECEEKVQKHHCHQHHHHHHGGWKADLARELVPYIGMAVNNTKYRLTDANRALYPEARTNKVGVKFWVGLRLARYFGAELGMGFMDRAHLAEDKKIQISNTSFDLLGFLPLHEGVDFFIGPGLGYLRTKFTGQGKNSNSDIGFRWKTGFEFMLDCYLSGRIFYTYQDANDNKLGIKRLNKFGVGILYRFW